MDTSMICAHLKTSPEEYGNTLFVLSGSLYENIAKIQNEVSEVKLLFEPAGIYGTEFLGFLSGLDVGVVASNQEVLDSALKTQLYGGVGCDVVVGSHVINPSVYESAYIHGSRTFTVENISDMERVMDTVGKDIQFILAPSSLAQAESMIERCTLTPTLSLDLLSTDLHELSRLLVRWNLNKLHIGTINSVEEVAPLAAALAKLPTPLTPIITLGPSFLDNSVFVATRVLERQVTEDGEVNVVADLSLFDELACYMDDTEGIRVLNDIENSNETATVYGNTYEDSDVVALSQSVPANLGPGDWLLLSNISLASLDDTSETLLLDKDNRVVSPRQTYSGAEVQTELTFPALRSIRVN